MEWIDIKDKLPPINERLLVINDYQGERYIMTMFFEGLTIDKNEPIWCEFFQGYEVGNSDEVQTEGLLEVYTRTTKVTHWMNLPDKPSDGKKV
jgi:hypothetical protein